MNLLRRTFLNNFGAVGAFAAAAASGLLNTGKAWALERNKAGFDASALADALKNLGAAGATESKDIVIKAPDQAENAGAVQVEVTSNIPGTTSIIILVDKNPRPLLAEYEFANGAEPYVFLRTKMAESSRIRALAKAGGKVYFATKDVGVTASGC